MNKEWCMPAKVRFFKRQSPTGPTIPVKTLITTGPLRDEFQDYFEPKMSVIVICRLRGNKLMLENYYNDGTFNEKYYINPTNRNFKHWFDV